MQQRLAISAKNYPKRGNILVEPEVYRVSDGRIAAPLGEDVGAQIGQDDIAPRADGLAGFGENDRAPDHVTTWRTLPIVGDVRGGAILKIDTGQIDQSIRVMSFCI